jgi:hypothetical protein
MKQFVICLLITFSINNSQAQIFTTTNLPIVKLFTNGNPLQQSPAILGGITITNNASGLNTVSDFPNDLKSLATLNVRGSTSSGFDQKSYSIELRDSANTAMTVNKTVLGMPTESDWILYGPYTDKTFMRNVLTYTVGREMGEYAPRCKFVELTIDASYQGVYVMMEKIKRDSNRVDISKLTNLDNSGEEVTGGYILKVDKFTGAFIGGFPSSAGSFQGQTANYFFQYDYPKQITLQQEDYIKKYVDSFESTLKSSGYKDALTGYRKYINVRSFIHYFLSNELGNNVDGYRLSTYMYKKKSTSGDGKLHMGPLWDFNLAYGNADYCDGWRNDSWAYNQPCNQNDIPFWWKRLLQDTNYTKELKCRFTQLRKTTLSNARLEFLIDSMINYVGNAATNRHYLKYPIIGTYVWPNYYVGNTYKEETDTLKSWINKRLAWLDNNIPGQLDANCLTTPVALASVDVTASAEQQNISLTWSIYNDKQIGSHYILRSKDAVNFEKIGSLYVHQKYNQQKYIDYNPLVGKNFYKLQIVTTENIIIESNIVSADVNTNNLLNINPTIIQDQLNIQLSSSKGNSYTLDILDYNGRIMAHKSIYVQAGVNTVTMNTQSLPSGIYCIKVSDKQQGIMTKRFTKL